MTLAAGDSTRPGVQTAAVIHIRFVSALPAGAVPFLTFTDPRPLFAMRESIVQPDMTQLLNEKRLPAGENELAVLCLSNTAGAMDVVRAWVTPADDRDADLPIHVANEDLKLKWIPGRAILIGSSAACESALRPLAEFSFYESELRRLEHSLLKYQASADADIKHAYNIAGKTKTHWDRLYATMEELYGLRLQFARLEPYLFSIHRRIKTELRPVIRRLIVRADAEARLEALSDRLEVVEDLYEGAIDRITDYRNYRKGALLEVAIVVILLLELILLVIRHP